METLAQMIGTVVLFGVSAHQFVEPWSNMETTVTVYMCESGDVGGGGSGGVLYLSLPGTI